MHNITLLSSVKNWSYDDHNPGEDPQRAAMESWKRLGVEIVLFNNPFEVMLSGVTFVPTDERPKIKDMLTWYMERHQDPEDIVVIVNSDIVLTPDILRIRDIAKTYHRVWAATSFRWQNGQVTDQGLDIFCGSRRVIYEASIAIPHFLEIGKVMWDNWMNGFLSKTISSSRYFDLTPWKAVHHVPHDRPIKSVPDYTPEQVDEVLHHPAIMWKGVPTNYYPVS